MKKVIVRAILAGATILSLVIVTSFGCGEQDQLGKEGSAGGAAGVPNLKLDGSVSGNGSSGGGGSGGAPSTSTKCGSSTSNTTRQPPDVLVVLDRSSSMNLSMSQDCYCAAGTGSPVCADPANCTNRWQAVSKAVVDTVSGSSDVQWGLKFFSTPGAAQCVVSAEMEVPISASSAAAVRSQIESGTLSQSTPTAAALKAATAYLRTLTDGRPRFILLATDGEPNCANGTSVGSSDINGASTAAGAAFSAGFPVYVVGIGPSLNNLTRLAQSGGTGDYYPVTSPQQLVDAFAAIETLVASCTFTLSLEPGADLDNVAVYLDKQLVAKDPQNGWSFGGGNQTVVLNGDACERVTSGRATSVEVLVGCEGVPPPPTIP